MGPLQYLQISTGAHESPQTVVRPRLGKSDEFQSPTCKSEDAQNDLKRYVCCLLETAVCSPQTKQPPVSAAVLWSNPSIDEFVHFPKKEYARLNDSSVVVPPFLWCLNRHPFCNATESPLGRAGRTTECARTAPLKADPESAVFAWWQMLKCVYFKRQTAPRSDWCKLSLHGPRQSPLRSG